MYLQAHPPAQAERHRDGVASKEASPRPPIVSPASCSCSSCSCSSCRWWWCVHSLAIPPYRRILGLKVGRQRTGGVHRAAALLGRAVVARGGSVLVAQPHRVRLLGAPVGTAAVLGPAQQQRVTGAMHMQMTGARGACVCACGQWLPHLLCLRSLPSPRLTTRS